jgi:hypothetical protein
VRAEVLAAPAVDLSRWVGAVLCRDVLGADRRSVLSKGHRLDADDAPALAAAAPEAIHIVWLDEGDVDEDTAALRLAAMVAGPGADIHRPVESQVRLSATWRGLAQVDAAALATINALDGITIFTVSDGTPVERGSTLAGVKITPLAIPGSVLKEAEAVATSVTESRAVRVQPFLPLRVSAVVRQVIEDESRQRFEGSLRRRVRWLGGSVERIGYPADRAAARAALFDAASGADLVLVVGVNSVDPLEGTWRDLIDAGASVIRRGLPTHPGSSYWLVTLGDVPVIGVGSCGMFSRRSALDLLLIRCFAGGSLDREFLAGLGHGGLLGAEQHWRIPVYDRGPELDER